MFNYRKHLPNCYWTFKECMDEKRRSRRRCWLPFAWQKFFSLGNTLKFIFIKNYKRPKKKEEEKVKGSIKFCFLKNLFFFIICHLKCHLSRPSLKLASQHYYTGVKETLQTIIYLFQYFKFDIFLFFSLCSICILGKRVVLF